VCCFKKECRDETVSSSSDTGDGSAKLGSVDGYVRTTYSTQYSVNRGWRTNESVRHSSSRIPEAALVSASASSVRCVDWIEKKSVLTKPPCQVQGNTVWRILCWAQFKESPAEVLSLSSLWFSSRVICQFTGKEKRSTYSTVVVQYKDMYCSSKRPLRSVTWIQSYK